MLRLMLMLLWCVDDWNQAKLLLHLTLLRLIQKYLRLLLHNSI